MGLVRGFYTDRKRNSPNRDLRKGKVSVDTKNGEPIPMTRIIPQKWIDLCRQIRGINR